MCGPADRVDTGPMRDLNGLDHPSVARRTPTVGGHGPTLVAGLAVAVNLAAVVAWVIDLATRPPCPDNYVRLVDLAPAMPEVGAVAAAIAALLLVGTRRLRRRWICGALAVVVLAFGALTFTTAAFTLRANQLDPGGDCWTF
jgi:hypothetical protein